MKKSTKTKIIGRFIPERRDEYIKATEKQSEPWINRQNNASNKRLGTLRRFERVERDEYATKDDLHMHKIAMEELQRGETVPHDSVDWS